MTGSWWDKTKSINAQSDALQSRDGEKGKKAETYLGIGRPSKLNNGIHKGILLNNTISIYLLENLFELS